ncbi:MAG: hypothetical protein FRX49_09504 [Trebouxia sp. A1-2]|nr:MAG: hypothetical protein FRX49_09504 [Trebouxia sp. A1-2]
MELPPDIYFSETEFEQAGLLHDTDSCTVASPSRFGDGEIPPVPEKSLQRTSIVAQNEQPSSMPVGLTAEVIRKQANRDHQKRFRMRQKARSEAMQAQLESTLLQLQELKLQKLELEQRLHRRAQASSAPRESEQRGRQANHVPPDLNSLPPLTTSISGKSRLLTIEELISMPVQQFEELWEDYLGELKHCLNQHNQMDSFDYQWEARLHQLTFEAFMLAEEVFKQRARVYDSKATTDLLKLSDKQIQDLMFIRRVWYVKHHLLSSQRKAVAANILEASPTPVVNVTKIAASAVQLEQQAEDEHDVILRVKWAIHCGVLNVRQAARWFTQIDGCHEQAELLDFIAAQNGFPCRKEVSANIDEPEFGKDWNLFQQYTDKINPSVSWPAEYVPIDQRPANVMQLTLY